MAEAVGLAASLVTLTGLVVKTGELTQGYRHAPDEVHALQRELEGLKYVFERVEEYCCHVLEV